jgi:hypothetical protein
VSSAQQAVNLPRSSTSDVVVWRESLIFCFMAVLSTSWPVLAFAILVTGLVNQLEKFLCVARLLNGGHKARVKFQGDRSSRLE